MVNKRSGTSKAKGRPKVPALSEGESDYEGDHFDDFDFASAQSFLNTDPLNSGPEPRRQRESDDRVREYESSNRKWSKVVDNDSGHLLVRDSRGKWTAPTITSTKEEGGGNDESGGNECIMSEESEHNEDIEKTKARHSSFKEWSQELSSIAKAITENSEENYGKLKSLKEFYKVKDPQRRIIAFVSTVAIFNDILPAYSIRELTDTEKAMKVSREVQAIRNYELALLSSYSDFVSYCKSEFSSKRNKSSGDLIAYKALCELCKSSSARSFNHFESILSVVASSSAVNQSAKIRLAGCKALKAIFGNAEDPSGRVTMLTLKALSNALREREYMVKDAELFVALQSVKLQSQDFSSASNINLQETTNKVHSHLSKKERKEERERKKELRKTTMEAAVEHRKQQQKWARESREHLFGILFGYLKSGKKCMTNLPACMTAIGKFANFLGIEYFADLTNVIKGICSEKNVPCKLSLSCILTVLQMASLQESSSSLDLKFFFDLYYGLLKCPEYLSSHSDLSNKVFTMLFRSKRLIPRERVAAFAHRLLSGAVQCPNQESKKQFTGQLCDLLVHYPSIKPLIEEEPLGNGAYMPDCDNPDICKPFCKRLDLHVLVKQDPQCSQLIKKTIKIQ